MSEIFVCSDMHFGHANIIKYCNRPFRDVDHMDEALIENWNEVVRPGDLVYHLGDFCWGADATKYTSRLNGDIVNIRGNHDRGAIYAKAFYRQIDEAIVPWMDGLVYMNHYPVWMYQYDAAGGELWRSHQDRSPGVKHVLLYGHVHNGEEDVPPPAWAMNISIEKLNYEPKELGAIVSPLFDWWPSKKS